MYLVSSVLPSRVWKVANMQHRYLLLLAFAALLVAAPLVRCQDDDDSEEVFVDASEAASPEPAQAAAAGAGAGGIADMATEYLNTATELGKQYAGQAAELAQQYLGSYGEYLDPVLDKLGLKKSDKSEL